MRPMTPRFVSLAATMYVSVFCGMTSAFGLISPTFKNTFHWTQEQLQIVGTAGNFGDLFGILGGLCFDRYGPTVTACGGSFIAFIGWGLMYLAVVQRVHLGLIGFSFAFVLANHGLVWLDAAAVGSNAHNFPSDTGLAIALGKSVDGLSASIFAQIYVGFFEPHDKRFLLLLPCALLVMVNLIAPLLKLVSSEQRTMPMPPMSPFISGFCISGALALYVLVVSLTEEWLTIGRSTRRYLTVGMLCLLSLFTFLPLVAAWRPAGDAKNSEISNREDCNARLLADAVDSDGDSENSNGGSNGPGSSSSGSSSDRFRKAAEAAEAPMLPAREMALSQCVVDPTFWMLFLVMACGFGGCNTVVNNVAQLEQSFAPGRADECPEHGGSVVFVSLLSICSCAGRIASGVLSDLFQATVPRPVFLLAAICAVAAAMTLLAASDSTAALYSSCALTGLAYGALWTLTPAIARELFGERNLGANYKALVISSTVGSLSFSTGLVGVFYDQQPKVAGSIPGEASCCRGHSCFRAAFTIVAGACASALLVCCALVYRTRALCQPARRRALAQQQSQPQPQQASPTQAQARAQAQAQTKRPLTPQGAVKGGVI